MNLKDQVILVTGAGQGIGFAYADYLAELGAKVVLISTRNAASAAEKLAQKGLETMAFCCDISKEDEVEKLVKEVVSKYGKIDAVINNAGISSGNLFANVSAEEFARVMQVNVNGTINLVRAVLPVMLERQYGRIVNTTSQAGFFGIAGLTSYSTSKGAVHGFTRALALECKSANIMVNEIAPSAATAMSLAHCSPEQGEILKKIQSPYLVAPLAAYLASPECKFTGKSFEAGAGRISEIFIGTCVGYYNENITVDDLMQNWSKVGDKTDFVEIEDGMLCTKITEIAKERAAKQ